MNYRIKQIPEDFIVEEIISKNSEKDGEYIWFKLKKKNWDLHAALKIIAKKLRVSVNRFGYAGLKDKRAVTTQNVSVWNVNIGDLKKIKIRDIKLSNFRKANRPISLGDLKSNRFRIVVRNINKNQKTSVMKNIIHIKDNGIINLFGEQRFGSKRKITHIVGKYIIKGNLRNAVWLYLTESSENEPEDTRKVRNELKKSRNVKQALATFPRKLRYEIVLLNSLINDPQDYASALRKLPKNFRRMFVHAYQAYLWNITALAVGRKDIKVPIVGYETDLNKYREIKGIIENILNEEGITTNDFKIRSIPELSSKGCERDLVIFPKNFRYKVGNDELNSNKLKIVLEFEIPKGSYATVVVSEVMK